MVNDYERITLDPFFVENKDSLLLYFLIKACPIFQKSFSLDTAIGITDKEKFLCMCNGKESNLGNTEGKKLQPLPNCS